MIKWINHGQYWELIAPQKDLIWLQGRKGRVTATSAYTMTGLSFFKDKTPEIQGKIIAGILEEVFDDVTLKIMEHGNVNEDPTRKWVEEHFNIKIVERGLVVPVWDSEIGGSVDGDIVGCDGIIEIKCPQKMYKPILEYMEKTKKGCKFSENYHGHIYPSHFFQIQHNLKIMGKKFCIYVVNSVSEGLIFTHKVNYDEDHWNKYYPIIKDNYNKYVKPHLDGKYPILPL